MRELVYLSDRKLRQFVVDRPQGWLRRAAIEGEVRIPALGGVKLGRAAGVEDGPAPDLEDVVAALDRSERAARWFAEEGLRPGQWVAFDAPLNYQVVPGWNDVSTLMFVDANQCTAEYPSGGTVRLLLHGSPEHLVGYSEMGPGLNGSEVRREVHRRSIETGSGACSSTVEIFENIIIGDPGFEGRHTLAGLVTAYEGEPAASRRLKASVWSFLELFDSNATPETAAWMAGLSRITAVVPGRRDPLRRIVIATPLYVERVSPPDPTAT